jgi:hypothetical protein
MFAGPASDDKYFHILLLINFTIKIPPF